MTVNELIEELTKVKESGHGEQEVFYFTDEGRHDVSEVLPDYYGDDVIILL